MHKRIIGTLGGLIALALIGGWLSARHQAAAYSIRFLDIGQGDAALITGTKNVQVLVDAGPDSRITGHLAAAMPTLDRRIEYAVISHPHADHYRGFRLVIEKYQVGTLFVSAAASKDPEYQGLLESAKRKGAQVSVPISGQQLAAPGLQIRFLDAGQSDPPPRNLNNASVVMSATINGHTAFFSGDAEDEQERELSRSGLPPVEVLKVPHHGSRTSSSEEFLNQLKPRIAVISVGHDNRYGHPVESTLQRLAQHRATVYRTDRMGAVTIDFKNARTEVETERDP